MVNVPYCAVRGTAVACRAGIADCIRWASRADAWRNIGNVLTWETQEGAQLFVDMNGGTVTPLAEVFDQSVILSPIESQPTVPE